MLDKNTIIKIDVRIMASPKRQDQALEVCNKLGLTPDAITWDDRPDGGNPRYTSQKTWLEPMPNDATHRMVIQDDAILCDDFMEAAYKCINFKPKGIWTLYQPLEDKYEGYFRTCIPQIAGVCIVMPREIIQDVWNWCDEHQPDNEHDDSCISLYCFHHTILPMTTCPSLCDERGDSLLGHNAARPLNFNKHAAHVKDWTCTDVRLLI